MVCFGSGCGSSRSLSKCWKKQNFRRKTAVLALYLSTVKYMFSCRLMAGGQGFHFCATYTEWSRCKMVRARVRTHTLAREWGKWRERKREREREREEPDDAALFAEVTSVVIVEGEVGGGGRDGKGEERRSLESSFMKLSIKYTRIPADKTFDPLPCYMKLSWNLCNSSNRAWWAGGAFKGKGGTELVSCSLKLPTLWGGMVRSLRAVRQL